MRRRTRRADVNEVAAERSGQRASRLLFLLAFVACVAVQGTFTVIAPASLKASPSPDYESFYGPVGENVLEGRGFSLSGEPALRYPPGYPTVLAAVFVVSDGLGIDRGTGVVVLSLICSGLALAALVRLTERVFNLRIAVLTGLLWITYPLNLFTASSTGSEAFFTLILYACVLVYVLELMHGNPSWAAVLLTGTLAGAASLIRPIGALVGVLLAAVLIFVCPDVPPRRRVALGAGLLLANLIVIAPWLIWSSTQAGEGVPLSTGGPASALDGLTIGADPTEPVDVDLPAPAQRVTETAWRQRESLASVGAIASFMGRQIGRRPLEVLSLLGAKALHAWYASESRSLDKALALMQLPYLLLIGYGLVKARRADTLVRFFLIVSLVLSLYFWAMTVAALSIVRYMTPVLGLLLIFAASALLGSRYFTRHPPDRHYSR